MSPLAELMMLKKMVGDNKSDSTIVEDYDKFTKWLEQRDEVKKKKEEESKKKKTPTPTFSAGQVFFMLIGLGPFVGIAAMALQAQAIQYLLDIARSIH